MSFCVSLCLDRHSLVHMEREGKTEWGKHTESCKCNAICSRSNIGNADCECNNEDGSSREAIGPMTKAIVTPFAIASGKNLCAMIYPAAMVKRVLRRMPRMIIFEECARFPMRTKKPAIMQERMLKPVITRGKKSAASVPMVDHPRSIAAKSEETKLKRSTEVSSVGALSVFRSMRSAPAIPPHNPINGSIEASQVFPAYTYST